MFGLIIIGFSLPAFAQIGNESYRPQFHFSPAKNWMNDPNGLVYHNGEYHLFFQHNPFGNSWGHMSWGHAVSKDLVNWKHLPVAIPEEGDEMIFSGSAVVDNNNTSGFGINSEPPLVAIYTGHFSAKRTEVQSLAYSNDNGRTWKKYSGNPVLDIKKSDFRDPKVIWYQPANRWIMVVALANDRKVQFYSSPNLKEWTLLQEFDPQLQRNEAIECPDFYPLVVDNNPEKQKWVLAFSQGPLHYIVGDFDGTGFNADRVAPGEQRKTRIDYGFDHYALQSYSDIPAKDGRRISIAWMHNFAYEYPTSPWKCNLTFPLKVELKTIRNKVVLVQNPVAEISNLRSKKYSFKNKTVSRIESKLKTINSQLTEISAEFDLGNATKVGFKVCKGEKEETLVYYDVLARELIVDRSKSGNVSFDNDFYPVSKAPLEILDGNRIRIHMLVDKASIEVFGNSGETVQTNLIYPSVGSNGIGIFSEGGDAKVRKLNIWELKSIYQ